MDKYIQTAEEINTQFIEQVNFLISSVKSYDDGTHSEAKRIAVVLRVLFHNTEKSKSLLRQIGKDSNLLILDTSLPYSPSSLLPYIGLCSLNTGTRQYEPFLYDRPPNGSPQRLATKEWWNKMVIDDKKTQFSRKDLVLHLVNQDGGAHVDPFISPDYAALSKKNSLGFSLQINGNHQAIENIVYSTIRQIAFEFLESIRNGLG